MRFSSPGLLVAGLLLACGGSSPASTETGTDATTDPTTEVSTSTTAPTTAEPTTVAPTEGTTVEPDTTSTTTNAAPTSTTTEACRAECGDGVVACDEECDDGADNNDFLQGACRTDCTAARCGDGVVDYLAGEECDDLGVGAGCSATCQIEAPVTCGDGQLDLDQGEECDDANLDPGDGCSPACQLEPLGLTCGDGTVDLLEECDDANLDNGDGCNPTCNLANDTSLFVGSPGNLGLVDGVGVGARISGTGGLAVDSHYLYLADAQNNCIRRIDIATAAVETIAGSTMGQSGYADDPVGLNARFAGLDAIATDGKTLWVTDNMNRRLRAVSLTPPYAVTTVAGSGAIGVDDGVGDAASFDDTRGLTYYAGHVYMVDASAAVLRRFDPATQEVLTLAGQAYVGGVADGIGDAAQFVSPRYLASDNSGVLYIADTNGYHIRSFNTVTGYVGTLAGNGVAGYIDGVGLDASIHRPRGLASDGTSLYFGEFEQHTVRQVVVATGAVSTNAGQHCGGEPCQGGYVEGVGVAARFHGPFALAFHPGSNSLFILDSANRVIRRMQ